MIRIEPIANSKPRPSRLHTGSEGIREPFRQPPVERPPVGGAGGAETPKQAEKLSIPPAGAQSLKLEVQIRVSRADGALPN